MQVKAWYDQSDLILESASSLRNAIVIGVVLAALVLLVFLRDWKVTLAAVVAVPAGAGGHHPRAQGAGPELQHHDPGRHGRRHRPDHRRRHRDDRAHRAAAERRSATTAARSCSARWANSCGRLVSSSAATIVIFVPLAFLTGVTGAFFKALSDDHGGRAGSILPGRLVGRAGAGRAADQAPPPHAPRSIPTAAIMRRYRARSGGDRRPPDPRGDWRSSRWRRSAGSPSSASARGFIPKIDEGGFILDYVAPPGMSLTETDRLMRQVEAIIRATPDVDTYSRRTGVQLGGGLTEPNTGRLFHPPEDQGSPADRAGDGRGARQGAGERSRRRDRDRPADGGPDRRPDRRAAAHRGQALQR